MLRSLTWKQFLELRAYDQIDPIGGVRGDWQAALVATAFANITLAARGASKRFRVKDFLLEFTDAVKKVSEAKEGRSWQEMKFIAMMCAADANEKGKRKGR